MRRHLAIVIALASTSSRATPGRCGLIIAFGKGAGSRASMAVTILGGQVLCLLVTPVLYSYFDDLREWSPREALRRLLGRQPKTATAERT